MTKINILLSIILFFAVFTQAQTITNYARQGASARIEINWTVNNYGTVQWQKSADNGVTWQNIANANSTAYEFTANANSLYRAQITGQPECEPVYVTHYVKVVNFSMELSSVNYNLAVFDVTVANMNDADVVEYGYCYNVSEIYPRSYTAMQTVTVGKSLPAQNTFELVCNNLLPATAYSVRLFIKTADGSVIYGPARIAETLPGLKFIPESWHITQNQFMARFALAGFDGLMGNPAIKCSYGTTLQNLQSVNITDIGNYNFTTDTIFNLLPNTNYFLQVNATIDGNEQTITKQVKTLPNYNGITVDTNATSVEHTIQWDKTTTLKRISPEGLKTEYPRILRVNNDTLLCSYHGGSQTDYWVNIYLQKSYDNGQTWTAPTVLLDKEKSVMGQRYWRFCNPELVKLDNGWILMPFVGNGNPETNNNCHVMVMISKDNGQTWGDPQIIGRGRTWEPMVVQLPNGELELFVASEAKWYNTSSNMYQEILFSRSTDYGQTWTEFKRACYSPARRDGMPAAINMQGNKGILFSIEVVNDNGFGSPSLAHRPLNGEWDTTQWDGVSDNKRWHVNVNAMGGAPYIIQLPTGEIVLSAHVNGRNGIWQTSYPRIVVGDKNGKNFTTPVTPITNLPANQGAYYNSLFLKDNETVWLVVTHSEYSGSTRVKGEIKYLEGKIVKKN